MRIEMSDVLYVIAAVSNSRQYQSRYTLFRNFQRYMNTVPGIKLYVVELAHDDRLFEITESGRSDHIQLRTNHELWHKENLVNIGVSRLPSNWKYMAWLDGDIEFDRIDWASETIKALQHHKIVQPWVTATDLGPNNEEIGDDISFAYQYCHGRARPVRSPNNPYKFAHPGYAWAMTREAWNGLGGLIDFCILGAADHHMSWAWTGAIDKAAHGKMGEEYFKACKIWEARCIQYIKGDIGYVDGNIRHYWHGPKKKRYYVERWEILVKNDFNPYLDLKYDWQGVLQLTDRNPQLREDIGKYFAMRDEDSIIL
jgi:hypothetical protein